MLKNVLYERKNMKFEDLVKYCFDKKLLVICCIDSHFTAFKILNKRTIIAYDPLSAGIKVVKGEEDC